MVFDSSSSAKGISLNSSFQSATGAVSAFDRSDFYRLDLKGSSSVNFSLNGLGANASLTLMDTSGRSLLVSNRTGTSAEAINTNLAAGTYYINVSQVTGSTTYKLNWSSNAAFANIDDNVNWFAGDFNGDGFEDVLRQEQGVLVDGGNDVQFFLGNASGGFQSGINVANDWMHGNRANLVAGDFNGDGKTDFIRQEKGTWVNGVDDVQIMTLQNGNFQAVANIPNMGALNGNNVNLIAGDFNADGRTDLIRQEKGAWVDGVFDVEVMLSSGGWNFSPPFAINNMAAMTGNNVALVASGSDVMRLETGALMNGSNDVQFTSFVNNNFGAFVNNPTDAFSKATVPKPWEAAIAKAYTENQSVLGQLVRNQATNVSPLGTTGRFSAYSSGGSIHWSAKTGTVVITPEMEKIYAQVGGSGTWLGMPTGKQYTWKEGVRQDFEGGYLYRDSNQAKAFRPDEMPSYPWTEAIAKAYVANQNILGQATSDNKPTLVSPFGTTGRYTTYDNGASIHWSAKTGAVVVTKEMEKTYTQFGGLSGWLGMPTDSQYLWNGGIRQNFEGGYLFQNGAMSKALKANEMPFAVTGHAWTDAINRAGGLAAVGDKRSEVKVWGQGEAQDFVKNGQQNTVMKANGSNTAYIVGGEIWNQYYIAKGPASFLGYPTSDRYESNGGYRQNFQGGFITQNAKGVIEVFDNSAKNRSDVLGNPFITALNRVGGTAVIGGKTNEVRVWGQGEVQDFEVSRTNRSIIMKLNGSDKAYVVSGDILEKYYRAQGPAGLLGYPTSDRYEFNGSYRQDFEGGFMTQKGGVIEVFNKAGQNRSDVLSGDFSWAQPVYLPPHNPNVMTLPSSNSSPTKIPIPIYSNDPNDITPQWLKDASIRNALQDYFKDQYISHIEKKADGGYDVYLYTSDGYGHDVYMIDSQGRIVAQAGGKGFNVNFVKVNDILDRISDIDNVNWGGPTNFGPGEGRDATQACIWDHNWSPKRQRFEVAAMDHDGAINRSGSRPEDLLNPKVTTAHRDLADATRGSITSEFMYILADFGEGIQAEKRGDWLQARTKQLSVGARLASLQLRGGTTVAVSLIQSAIGI